MTSTTVVQQPDPTLRAAIRTAAIFAAVKLLLTFALTLYTQHIGYSYFRDEFYYIACGRHLAWGYVDHGPVVAVQARLGEILFGDSVFAIRILSAAAGAVMIFLCGLIAWALGGRRPAQSLATMALICAPQFIGTDGFLSMNSFEPMFWMGCVLALLMMLRGRSERLWWLVFGLSTGIGMLNKPSMVFFLFALGIGLLCTPQRQLLFTRWAAFGIALLISIPVPYLLWQWHNHWPLLEFLENGRRHGKNVIVPILPFTITQILDMHPINVVIWGTGVVALLRGKSMMRARWLGITYLVFFALMFAMHAKDYYLAGIYPAMIAAGAVAWEHRFAASRGVRMNSVFAFPVYTTILIITSILILPMSSPVLKPEMWVRYTRAMKLSHPEQEHFASTALPQFFADRFGWQQELNIVSATYARLSEEDKKRVCVFAGNYGEAGALQFLGPVEGKPLPRVISGQNNYWLWGMQGCTGDLVIAVIYDTPEELAPKYEHVEIVGRMDDPWSMSFEHRNIYLLRGRKPTAPVNWADEKDYF